MSMKYIGDGVTREVFLTKRYAIKIPKIRYGWKMFLEGLLANMQEREFSATGWPELCPVVFALPGGWLVVMRRAESLTDAEFRSIDPDSWGVTSDYRVPVEAKKRSSFGKIDGRIVAVDYGS